MCQRLLLKIQSFFIRTDGPTAVEYAVMLALIVGVTIAAITIFGKELKALSDLIEITLNGALSNSE